MGALVEILRIENRVVSHAGVSVLIGDVPRDYFDTCWLMRVDRA
jgi:hypothetical protein